MQSNNVLCKPLIFDVAEFTVLNVKVLSKFSENKPISVKSGGEGGGDFPKGKELRFTTDSNKD